VNAVTVLGVVERLSTAVEDLWSAVCELMLTVASDQPRGPGLAVTDHWVETVSELQGDVAAARAQLAAMLPTTMLPTTMLPTTMLPTTGLTAAAATPVVATLPDVVVHLHRAGSRYWRDIRGHEPVAQLRAGTRQRGGEWTVWRRSVEQSAARLVEPLESVADAVDAGWQELCQLATTPPGPWQNPSSADPYRRIP
jgi:hypothetical protein